MLRLLGAATAAFLLTGLPVEAADKVPNATCAVDGISAGDRTALREASVAIFTAQAQGRKPTVPAAGAAAGPRYDAVVVECQRRNGWTQAQTHQVSIWGTTSIQLAALESILVGRGVSKERVDRLWRGLSPQDHRDLAAKPIPEAARNRVTGVVDAAGMKGEVRNYVYYYLQVREERERAISVLLGE